MIIVITELLLYLN